MQLTHQTLGFIRWTRQVMAGIRAVRRWTTHGVVVAEAVSDVTRLIAFLLPLKTILLAASSGVPRYFPFIDPAQKTGWIIGLAATAFVFYGITLALEALAERLAEGASTDVLEGANEMALSSNQHEKAQNAYAAFCRVYASTGFLIVGGIGITALMPWLGAFLAAMIPLQYAFTAWVVSGKPEVAPTGLKGWVMNRFGRYLGVQQSITFLSGFLVILLPYLYGFGGNVLFALITVISLRQVLGAVTKIAKTGVKLMRQRKQINAFVFHNQPTQQLENPGTRNLRELFAKEARQQRSNEVLAGALAHAPATEVAWADSPRNIIHTFTIGPITLVGRQRWFQQQVFPPKTQAHLENESFLFRHIDRGRLYAPEHIGRFDESPFAAQILDFGQGRYLTQEEWQAWSGQLVTDILSCRPPAELVAAYRKSNRLMPQRIDTALLDRLAVAVDMTAEAEALEAVRGRLDEIRAHLEALPLHIDNQDFDRTTTVIDEQHRPLAMIWGRWALQPLGGGLMTSKHRVDVAALLPDLATHREDIATDVCPEDVELAGQCRELESYDARLACKAALALLPDIIDNLDTTRSARAA
jgi:hypothetical protein